MFKGQYKFATSTGFPVTYSKSDVVVYQGKIYQALNATQKNPLESPENWSFVRVTEPIIGSQPPILPKENQIWVSDTGNEYIYYFDGNSYQWIET